MTLRALGPAVLLLLAACGGSEPPPKVAEVPIDQQSQETPPSSNDSSSGSSSSSSPALSGSDSTASADNSAASPPPGKGGKKGSSGDSSAAGNAVPPMAAPSKAGPVISPKECSELSDKGIELMAFGDGGPLKGHSGKQMEQELAMLKQMAGNDPNFAKMKSECVKSIHRGQYECGMRARSSTEWQNCIR